MDARLVVLPADCRIGSARAQHEALRSAFLAGGDIEIDASAAEYIDIAGLQILASALKTAESQKKRLVLTAVSQPLQDAFTRAGLQLPTSAS
jgi:anti-anti-sigma factor